MNNTCYSKRYNEQITRAVGVEWNAYHGSTDTSHRSDASAPGDTSQLVEIELGMRDCV